MGNTNQSPQSLARNELTCVALVMNVPAECLLPEVGGVCEGAECAAETECQQQKLV